MLAWTEAMMGDVSCAGPGSLEILLRVSSNQGLGFRVAGLPSTQTVKIGFGGGGAMYGQPFSFCLGGGGGGWLRHIMGTHAFGNSLSLNPKPNILP